MEQKKETPKKWLPKQKQEKRNRGNVKKQNKPKKRKPSSKKLIDISSWFVNGRLFDWSNLFLLTKVRWWSVSTIGEIQYLHFTTRYCTNILFFMKSIQYVNENEKSTNFLASVILGEWKKTFFVLIIQTITKSIHRYWILSLCSFFTKYNVFIQNDNKIDSAKI